MIVWLLSVLSLMSMLLSVLSLMPMLFNALQKFYKKMSEMKPEVEYVIKTGRQVVERRQVDFPDTLNAQIDGIKQLYNQLGQQVRVTSLPSRVLQSLAWYICV